MTPEKNWSVTVGDIVGMCVGENEGFRVVGFVGVCDGRAVRGAFVGLSVGTDEGVVICIGCVEGVVTFAGWCIGGASDVGVGAAVGAELDARGDVAKAVGEPDGGVAAC